MRRRGRGKKREQRPSSSVRRGGVLSLKENGGGGWEERIVPRKNKRTATSRPEGKGSALQEEKKRLVRRQGKKAPSALSALKGKESHSRGTGKRGCDRPQDRLNVLLAGAELRREDAHKRFPYWN